ncbi:G-protein coupled receptor Mth2 [Holothuria leucospilota]|uniref:G-protein coupled receptor Mth2 n=1 Tax=Holothuria leucospilota TaxID=206669 RepID=A0A9Q1BHH5_HOLLE|nr:G-protein coupled receptor Mth2 [Holothuria leucospilota]
MKKLFLVFVNLTLALKAGYTEILWKSVDLGVSSNYSYQSCRDFKRTCKCDQLCAFYRDCCKDYKSNRQTIVLYNQNNQSLNFDDFECRLMPGYDEIDPSQKSNCIERSSYWVISKCPRTASKTLKTQCEEEHALGELVKVRYIRPVNDALGNVYKNYYCAVCHNIPSDEVIVWGMKEACRDCREELPLSQDHFINLTSQDCYFLLEKPTIMHTRESFDIRLRSCYNDMVPSCPLGSNPYDSTMCSQFSSPGYFRGDYYKNIFCARCNGLTNTQYWSDEYLLECSKEDIFPIGVGGVMLFLDPLCSLIRCSRPLSLCSGTDRTSLQYLSLTANDTFRCSHLEERGERCFFQEAQLKNPTLLWKKMADANALWGNDQNQRHSATVFQLPENISDQWRIQLDKDLVDNVRRLSQKKRSCYLEYIEIVEVCSDQEWGKLGECNGNIVEVPGDEVLDNENNFLYELTQNLSKTMSPSWYTVHTRFAFTPRSFPVTRTLICLTHPEIQQDVTIWYRIFCGFCIAVAVVCHLATFVTYATFRALRNTFGISLMCFVMSLVIALSLLEFVADYVTGITYLCKTVAIASHFFWLSSFCWVTVLARDLHVTLSPSKMRVRQASSLKRLASYCCFGWGLPCIIVALCITMWLIDIPEIPVMYGSAQGMSCWLYDDLIQLLAVAAPLVGCMSANVCFFLMISRSLYNYKKDSRVTQNDFPNRKRRIIELLVYVKVSLLMGFAWIVGFLADFTRVKVLWWLFYLSFLIQACLIFVFFGLSGKVRNMWKESRAFRTSSTRITSA